LRFCVKKRSKHGDFRNCNLAVAAASDRRREGARVSKSFVDQRLGASMFHVEQTMNKKSGLSSSAIGFHFLLFFAFWRLRMR